MWWDWSYVSTLVAGALVGFALWDLVKLTYRLCSQVVRERARERRRRAWLIEHTCCGPRRGEP